MKKAAKSVAMFILLGVCVAVVKACSYELERRKKRALRGFSGKHRISPYNDYTC